MQARASPFALFDPTNRYRVDFPNGWPDAVAIAIVRSLSNPKLLQQTKIDCVYLLTVDLSREGVELCMHNQSAASNDPDSHLRL